MIAYRFHAIGYNRILTSYYKSIIRFANYSITIVT